LNSGIFFPNPNRAECGDPNPEKRIICARIPRAELPGSGGEGIHFIDIYIL